MLGAGRRKAAGRLSPLSCGLGSGSTVSSSSSPTGGKRRGGVVVQLQHWARDANGKQKQFKLHGGGGKH